MSSFQEAVEWAQRNTPRPTSAQGSVNQTNDSNSNKSIGSENSGGNIGGNAREVNKTASSNKTGESSWTDIFRSFWFWIIVVVIFIIVIGIIYYVYYRVDPDEKVFIDEKSNVTSNLNPTNPESSKSIPPNFQSSGQSSLFDLNPSGMINSGQYRPNKVEPTPTSLSERSSTFLPSAKPSPSQFSQSSQSYNTPTVVSQNGKQYEILELPDGQAPPEGFIEVTE